MAKRGQNDGPFGWCPHCLNHDGYINIGQGHWFFCDVHGTRWFAGSNIFDSWKHETEEEQRRIYDAKGFNAYTEVEPVFPTDYQQEAMEGLR